MYIFGGILELTKEINEMLCYDFDEKCFNMVEGMTQADITALQVSKMADSLK